MGRRQLLFVILLNSLISLAIAVTVVWIADMRRPDLEELAARYTPPPPVVLIPTATPEPVVVDAATPVPSPQQEAQATPIPTSSDPEIHVVQEGETLLGIAFQYNLSVEQLMEANNLDDPNFVFSGQRLLIPDPAGGDSTSDPAPQAATPDLSEGLNLSVEQPGNLGEEHVLIVNESNSAVNLQGWTLGKVDGPVYAFEDLPLFPGGSVRLHTESGDDDSLNRFWGLNAPVWESGSVVRLFNESGREVVGYEVP